MEEMDLAVSTKSRQEDYWQQTVDEYGAALERLAWAYEGDPERRRDLLQEIYFALWRSFENFDARCSTNNGFVAAGWPCLDPIAKLFFKVAWWVMTETGECGEKEPE